MNCRFRSSSCRRGPIGIWQFEFAIECTYIAWSSEFRFLSYYDFYSNNHLYYYHSSHFCFSSVHHNYRLSAVTLVLSHLTNSCDRNFVITHYTKWKGMNLVWPPMAGRSCQDPTSRWTDRQADVNNHSYTHVSWYGVHSTRDIQTWLVQMDNRTEKHNTWLYLKVLTAGIPEVTLTF
jgi:hypothetical protein